MAQEGINRQLRGVLNCLADVFERSGVWKRRDLPKVCEVCPVYGICLKLRRVIGEQESAFRELAK
ncbi:hypothetical protein ES703_08224 [subsurface metagenome]